MGPDPLRVAVTKCTMVTMVAKQTKLTVVPKVPRSPCRTIAVLNQKGGVGKTTLTVNLAAGAHLSGRRTIIVDCDTQGSAFDWSNARPEGSRLTGLTVARADKALSLPRFRELTDGYDVAIIDGPPRLGDITRAAAVAADVVIVPLRPGGFDWWAASETIDLLDSADSIREQHGLGKTRRVFVVNGAVGSDLPTAALAALGDLSDVAPLLIRNRVVYPRTATAGDAVLSYAARADLKPKDRATVEGAAAEIAALWAVASGQGVAHA
jgi:chromosome partitioning protein